MSLSERDKIIISNTISGYISNIPVHSLADFSSIVAALQLLKSGEVSNTVNSEIKDVINIIHGYMDPEFCAVLPENQSEFISLCYQIINNRIQYFENLSSESKLSYIDEQSAYRNNVVSGQETMNRATPPSQGSDAHVISEDEMLLQQQAAFNNMVSPPLQSTFPPPMSSVFTDEPFDELLSFFGAPITGVGGINMPQARPEPIVFGGWIKTDDTWDVADGVYPYGRTPGTTHLNRSRVYENNKEIKKIEILQLNEYTDDSISICINASSDSMAPQQFIETLNTNGIYETDLNVKVFSRYPPMLIVTLTQDTVDETLSKVYNVIDSLEGDNSINDDIKNEIYQSFQQRMPNSSITANSITRTPEGNASSRQVPSRQIVNNSSETRMIVDEAHENMPLGRLTNYSTEAQYQPEAIIPIGADQNTFFGNSSPGFNSYAIRRQCNDAGIYPPDSIINTYLSQHHLSSAFGALCFLEFRKAQVDTLKYLIEERGFNLEEAFVEITGIASVECLIRFHSIGLRTEHIKIMENHLSEHTEFDFFILDLAIEDLLNHNEMTADELVESFKALGFQQMQRFNVD